MYLWASAGRPFLPERNFCWRMSSRQPLLMATAMATRGFSSIRFISVQVKELLVTNILTMEKSLKPKRHADVQLICSDSSDVSSSSVSIKPVSVVAPNSSVGSGARISLKGMWRIKPDNKRMIIPPLNWIFLFTWLHEECMWVMDPGLFGIRLVTQITLEKCGTLPHPGQKSAMKSVMFLSFKNKAIYF